VYKQVDKTAYATTDLQETTSKRQLTYDYAGFFVHVGFDGWRLVIIQLCPDTEPGLEGFDGVLILRT